MTYGVVTSEVLGTGLGLTQSPPGVDTHIGYPMWLPKFPQSLPRTGFQETICTHAFLFASAILAHVSPVFTVYVLHLPLVGMQSAPEVGKFAQKP